MSTDAIADWDVDRIRRETFVEGVETHTTLPSTNDRGLQLAADPQTEIPSLIVTEEQTVGRGRGNKTWWSSPGSLTFSLLLELTPERLPAARWPEVSLTVGSSICHALAANLPGEDVRLKWPNDVYLRGVKVCGVLVEIPPHTSGRMVVGVGLNVANSITLAPPELRQTAIALCDVGGVTSRLDVLIDILNELERQLTLLSEDAELVRSYWRRFDFLIGRSITLSDGIVDQTGTCVGIDDDGALLLRTEAGTRRCYGGVVATIH